MPACAWSTCSTRVWGSKASQRRGEISATPVWPSASGPGRPRAALRSAAPARPPAVSLPLARRESSRRAGLRPGGVLASTGWLVAQPRVRIDSADLEPTPLRQADGVLKAADGDTGHRQIGLPCARLLAIRQDNQGHLGVVKNALDLSVLEHPERVAAAHVVVRLTLEPAR